jgi:hypothetical protein
MYHKSRPHQHFFDDQLLPDRRGDRATLRISRRFGISVAHAAIIAQLAGIGGSR